MRPEWNTLISTAGDQHIECNMWCWRVTPNKYNTSIYLLYILYILSTLYIIYSICFIYLYLYIYIYILYFVYSIYFIYFIYFVSTEGTLYIHKLSFVQLPGTCSLVRPPRTYSLLWRAFESWAERHISADCASGVSCGWRENMFWVEESKNMFCVFEPENMFHYIYKVNRYLHK